MNTFKIRLRFTGSCLKQGNKAPYTPKNVVKLFIVYEMNLWDRGYDYYPTLETCLFGAVKLLKNADIDKYKCSRYDIGFNRNGTSSFSTGGFYKNVIIFGVDMNFSVHIDNKGKYVSVFGDCPSQGLDGTTFTAEKEISINFTV